jgi:hypothetical protein
MSMLNLKVILISLVFNTIITLVLCLIEFSKCSSSFFLKMIMFTKNSFKSLVFNTIIALVLCLVEFSKCSSSFFLKMIMFAKNSFKSYCVVISYVACDLLFCLKKV